MLINALAMSAALPTRRGFSALRVSCQGKSGPSQTYSIKEIKFLSGGAQLPAVSMTGDTSPSPLVASASSYNGAGFEAYRAFDGGTGTFWDSGVTEGFPTIQLYFGPGSALGISGIVMSSGYGGGAPAGFYIEGSQDLATWTRLASIFGLTWSNDETKTIAW
ncbi:discoidin domain-containing protein (plasmid) [Azospirillum sp. HJ39]|uniref:discoidin domain-containing protein n=1 Tax=Azospirillum sp. HJ39 TaxID=3159496 RepID=UPI0035568625